MAASTAPTPWAEIEEQLAANSLPTPTPLPPSVVLPGADRTPAENTGRALEVVRKKLLEPLIDNALRKGAEEGRVRAIKATQPWLVFATTHVAGARELLVAAGFKYERGDDDGAGGGGAAARYILSGVAEPTTLAAEARQQETTVLERAQLALRNADALVAGAPGARSSSTTMAHHTPDSGELLIKSRVSKSARDSELEALKKQLKDDRRRRAEAEERAKAAAAAEAAGDAEDRSVAQPFLEAAKKTVHYTGRLRNMSFEGQDFSIRRMRHSRRWVCGDPECTADVDGMELHWHLKSGGNLLYAYVVHMSPDATKVLHVGPELGYQYNALPHTEHFGKTLLTRRAVVSSEGKVSNFANSSTVAAVCEYCGVPFDRLW